MSAVVVERVGGAALVQDLGRPGWAHLGVPSSGALDPDALRLANRLVGNDEGAAGLEILLGGLRMSTRGSVRVALAGGRLPFAVNGRQTAWATSASAPDGATIEVGRSAGALRAWLAVAGGIAVPPVLGSRSTDTLGGLGPPAVAAGQVLPIGVAPPAPVAVPDVVPEQHRPSGPWRIGVRVGPRDHWFAGDSLAALWDVDLEVSSAADRVAVRLVGPGLVRRIPGELPSEGLVTGAIQVPGDGQPLIFLADHPTTGGYPVIGVVVDHDLPACAQLRPGDRVRLRPVHQRRGLHPSTGSGDPAEGRVVDPEGEDRTDP